MKHAKLATLVLLAVLMLPAALFADPVTWQVDPAHSNVAFSIRHFFTQVPGRFDDFSGTIQYDADNPSSSKVEFTVQATSIDTANANRDKDLRSANFFDVGKFPTLSFKSTKVKGMGKTLEVTGDLTIHGMTHTVTVPVEFLGSMETPMGPRAGFNTEFTIDRKEYGISWNRALDQGGAILGDDVKISINVEATHKQETKPAM